MKRLNNKQKENLATFYNNLALVLLAAGAVTPMFTGVENQHLFSLRLMIAIIGSGFFLQVSLDFLK